MESNPQQQEPQSRFQWLPQPFRLFSYWFNLIMQPALAILFVIGLAWLFGYMQRNHSWFNDTSPSEPSTSEVDNAQYACSMLCVFVGAPGRCPVCGMELQKIESQGDPKDIYGVTIAPTARRLANIKTVPALNKPVAKEFEIFGRVTYDETTEETVSAYVDGRIEDLLIAYTGATIRKGDPLAVLYSPDLYADQVGLLQAREAKQNRSTNQRVNRSNERLYQSARQRLIEQGLTETQINALESTGKADNRVTLFAPSSGTVIKKLVQEGKYVKTGMPILKIADLSTTWLMLEVYPKDAANIKPGQKVTVEIPSQVGKSFEGSVSFVDPMVDPKTQTVNVRVVIPNEAGLLKIGDLGKARIQSSRETNDQFVVVPRESVLINGSNSVAYVETEPGRFEFRKVKIAEVMGDRISIAEGIEPGEQVVASGAFMLDSTFNIQGKVSLIDPNRASPRNQSQLAKDVAEAKEIAESFKNLSPEDRRLAELQVICPVTEVKLGTMGMGAPIRIALAERDVMICCAGCETNLRKYPQRYLAILNDYKSSPPSDTNGEDAVTTTNSDLPKTDLPNSDLPKMEIPTTELPQKELPKKELPPMEVPK